VFWGGGAQQTRHVQAGGLPWKCGDGGGGIEGGGVLDGCFVRPEHLEIPPGVVDAAHTGRAVEELNKINKYKVCVDTVIA
jgi:hypothetical protein